MRLKFSIAKPLPSVCEEVCAVILKPLPRFATAEFGKNFQLKIQPNLLGRQRLHTLRLAAQGGESRL